MTVHVHDLEGCAPRPLAHYLKALGVLRLVAEQKDPGARGWWEGERFRLATHLDKAALPRFFLDDYCPTPLVAPWNRGSGFYHAGDPVMEAIAASHAPRLEPYAKAIREARSLLQGITEADALVRSIKARTKTNRAFQSSEQRRILQGSTLYRDVLAVASPEVAKELRAMVSASTGPPSRREAEGIKRSQGYKRLLAESEKRFKVRKEELMPGCRRSWRGGHQDWFASSVVLDQQGKAKFPALLGTGGNDGKLEFTSKFMQRLGRVFDIGAPDARALPPAGNWLEEALYGSPTPGMLVGKDGKVGQFLPGGAGGANSLAGFGDQDTTLLNPLDYILMLEGALLFAAALSRRGDARQPARAAAPFCVAAHAGGYASASATDEGPRGEQWMPLWDRPLTLDDLKRLLAEGRAQVGASSAREPLDVARAAARLGTARGVSAFVRYGYFERNGMSNLAVPLGVFATTSRPGPYVSCLDDLAGWLKRVRRHARDQRAPLRLIQAERRISDSCFAAIAHPSEPLRWQGVLEAMADLEAVMVGGSGFQAGPVPGLRPAWARAADDGSPEFRLALAFALQHERASRTSGRLEGIRRHWLPLADGRFRTRSEGMRQHLEKDPGVVMGGRDGVSDAIAVLERRLMEATQAGRPGLNLRPSRGAGASLGDLAALVSGSVDLNRLLRLARALMAIDLRLWNEAPFPPAPTAARTIPDDSWLVLRLALLPWPVRERVRVPCDPAIVRRLASGDASAAVQIALRRLRPAGLSMPVRAACTDHLTARRWAAALAFPVGRTTVQSVVTRFALSTIQES